MLIVRRTGHAPARDSVLHGRHFFVSLFRRANSPMHAHHAATRSGGPNIRACTRRACVLGAALPGNLADLLVVFFLDGNVFHAGSIV